ncbi:hypothetical protein ACFU67_01280 [Streptomyces rhizosphaericola]|uniref:hypothetical protein n=1 Tax=Streptomyces rhizosphaericola TaxID=2564098 RepID=UPI00369B6B7A
MEDGVRDGHDAGSFGQRTAERPDGEGCQAQQDKFGQQYQVAALVQQAQTSIQKLGQRSRQNALRGSTGQAAGPEAAGAATGAIPAGRSGRDWWRVRQR